MATPTVEWESAAAVPTVEYESPPPKQSNPGKQFIAGVSDIGTGLPSLAGLAGQGIEALYGYATNDKDLSQNWEEAGQEGLDKTLIEAGDSGRKAVEGALGIGDAETGVDQVARILGNAIPVPGLGTTALMSRGARAARNTFNVLTPSVKYTTPGATAVRAGAQVGIVGGIDQGVRGLIDKPTLFSDPVPQVEYIPEVEYADTVEQGIEDDPGNEGLQHLLDTDQAIQKESQWETAKTIATIVALGIGGAAAVKYRSHLRQKAALPGEAPVGRPASPHPVDRAIDGLVAAKTPQEAAKHVLDTGGSFLRTAKGNFVDSLEFVKTALKDSNMYSPSYWETVEGQIMADSNWMALRATEGDWGALSSVPGFTPTAKIPLSEIDRRFSTMDKQDQVKFTLALASRNELATSGWNTVYDFNARNPNHAGHGRWATLNDMVNDITATADDADDFLQAHNIQSRVRANLWQNARKGSTVPAKPVTQEMMRRGDAWLTSRPDMKELADNLGLWFEDSLNYAVARGQLPRDIADEWMAKMRFGGSLAYVPGMSATEGKGLMAKMTDLFGLTSTQGQETNMMAQWFQKAHESGDGILAPENALKAAGVYAHNLMRHLNTTAAQRNILFPMTNLQLDAHGMPDFTALRQVGTKETYAPRFIGVRDIKTGDFKLNDTDSLIKSTYEDLNAPNTSIAKGPNQGDEAVWLRINGKEYGFHVPNAGFRHALNINPALTGPINKTMNAFKRMMTFGTTGAGSLFAPIAGAFAAQQLSLNRMISGFRPGNMLGATTDALAAYPDALKGAKAHFVYEGSRLWANALKQGLETGTGISSLVPGFSRAMIPRLERLYQTSMLHAMRREGGSFASGPLSGASEFGGHVEDFLSQINPRYSRTMGVGMLQVAGRTWMALNRAMHEGAATGATMKEIKRLGAGATPNSIRTAMIHSKNLVGDVRRKGAKTEAIHASIPFSGATIQSMATIGRAIKSNPEWAIPALAGIVGVPALVELGWNHSVAVMDDTLYPDENGVGRTQNDYYWNYFTDRQRADNMIMLIPGVHPKHATLIPVSPELGLFRSTVIEGLDALFNFSNVGNAGALDENGKMFGSSLNRITDLAVPPPIGALVSGLTGKDIRAGADLGESGTTLLSGVPLAGGQRLNSSSGEERYVDSYLDIRTEAVIKELFGAAGAAYVSVAEAFHTGLAEKGDDLSRVLNATGDAAQALAIEGKRQSRYMQPLFGNVLRPSSDREITNQVMAKKGTLKKLGQDAQSLFSGGTLTADGQPIPGDSLVPPQDPIWIEAVADAKNVEAAIQAEEQEISTYKRNISTMGSSNNDFNVTGRTNITPQERLDIIDGYNLKIDELRARQLQTLKNYEAILSDHLSSRYGREIKVNLSDFHARPNPSEGSLLPASRTSPLDPAYVP